MSDYCVVVADAAKARLFALEVADIGEGGPNLVEISSLANSEAEAAGKEIYSDDNSGRNVSSGGGGAHGYDDHRAQHMKEVERRFAKIVAAAALEAVERDKSGCLVLAAESRMMGHLREALERNAIDLKVKEIVKDLTKLPRHELHEYLAMNRILPEREPAMS